LDKVGVARPDQYRHADLGQRRGGAGVIGVAVGQDDGGQVGERNVVLASFVRRTSTSLGEPASTRTGFSPSSKVTFVEGDRLVLRYAFRERTPGSSPGCRRRVAGSTRPL
jgi:hypothetical protein